MRKKVTVERLENFMRKLGMAAKGSGAIYITGGSSALLLGIREQTIDIDVKLDPEPPGAFEAIAVLKNELDLNVELASPDDFIPVPSDWKARSTYIDTINGVSFYHYDLVAQALAKLERGHSQDVADVRALLERGIITKEALLKTFVDVRSSLLRYPAIDAEQFEQKVREFIAQEGGEGR